MSEYSDRDQAEIRLLWQRLHAAAGATGELGWLIENPEAIGREGKMRVALAELRAALCGRLSTEGGEDR